MENESSSPELDELVKNGMLSLSNAKKLEEPSHAKIKETLIKIHPLLKERGFVDGLKYWLRDDGAYVGWKDNEYDCYIDYRGSCTLQRTGPWQDQMLMELRNPTSESIESIVTKLVYLWNGIALTRSEAALIRMLNK